MKQSISKGSLFGSLVVIFFSGLFLCGIADAASTVTWERPATNADGTPCTDLAGYKIYYDSDRAGAPYDGTDLNQGRSPIVVPVSSLQNPANPEYKLSGLEMNKSYYVTVTAYDFAGNESGFSNQIMVLEKNTSGTKPNADAGPKQIIAQSQLASGSLQVTLNGTASSAPDGGPLSYKWTQIKGSPVNLMGASTATPFFSVTSALSGQSLVFQLEVTNGAMEEDLDYMVVYVADLYASGNTPPSVTIVASSTTGAAPMNIEFAGVAEDPDGYLSHYLWIFGDGSTSAAQNPSHTFTKPGAYNVLFAAMDDDGTVSQETLEIVVSVPSSEAPAAVADNSKTAASQAETLDSDSDGLLDTAELSRGMNPDSKDTDGDGIDDQTEWGPFAYPRNSDSDHIIDALDTDADNDGQNDSAEGTGDADHDGALNYIDADDGDGPSADYDGDGFTNLEETTFGLNPNLADSDHDGIPDPEETTRIDGPEDSDGDGMADAVDPDSDDDGVPDDLEFKEDMDGDGQLDRRDAATATFLDTRGTVALKLLTKGGSFTNVQYDAQGLPEDGSYPRIPGNYSGFRFEIAGMAKGGTADLLLIGSKDFPAQARYWLYDGFGDATEIESTVSDGAISFALEDGAMGDTDNLTNGIIVSSGLIAESEPAVTTFWEQTAFSSAGSGGGSGGGGSGCSIHGNPNPYTVDGLLLLLPALFLLLRRLKRVT